MKDKKDFTGAGIIAGIIVWAVFVLIASANFSCLESQWNCNSDDLFIASAMGAGFLIPAYFVARLVSE